MTPAKVLINFAAKTRISVDIAGLALKDGQKKKAGAGLSDSLVECQTRIARGTMMPVSCGVSALTDGRWPGLQ